MIEFPIDPEDYCRGRCTIAVSILGAGGLSAGASIFGSQSAANTQMKAAQQGMQTQTQMQQQGIDFLSRMFGISKEQLQPFINAGQGATSQLSSMMPQWLQQPEVPQLGAMPTPPRIPTQADIENMPGFKGMLDIGLRATQNSAAARGLGSSGAALRGAADYTNTLTQSAWPALFGAQQTQWGDSVQNILNQFQGANTAFGNQNTNIQNVFGRLSGIAGQGSQAAGALTGAATSTGQSGAGSFGNLAQALTSLLTGGANAQAGATMAGANAVGGFANSIPLSMIASRLFPGQGTPATASTGQSYGPSDNFWAGMYGQ